MTATNRLPLEMRIGLFDRVWRDHLLPLLNQATPFTTPATAQTSAESPHPGEGTSVRALTGDEAAERANAGRASAADC
jgi:hypothetical protein